ncbi:MAG: cob(I)yrinic acid a,c-diamide adenosyltransferase [Agriterribacter sp.]
MATKIYTKTGDNGNTSLIGGTKVSKSHLRIETYGTVDELNAHIGLCRDMLTDNKSRNTLQKIQGDLFVIGALLACDPGKDIKMALPEITDNDILLLEKEIDSMDAVLPAMKYFILPGGNIAVSQLHIARCICRRAERCCVRLDGESTVNPLVLKYLNRLSDYLFVLARYTGHLNSLEDIPWVPQKIDK